MLFNCPFQVLYNFHSMVVGSSLFGSKPLFLIFEAKMTKDADDYWTKVTQLVDFLINIQLAGYAAWLTALNIKGRNSEVAHIQQIRQNRMAMQENVMNPLTLGNCCNFISHFTEITCR